jgi:hypothetical protein
MTAHKPTGTRTASVREKPDQGGANCQSTPEP